MTIDTRYGVEWQTAGGLLRAFEPTALEVELVARELADYYNDAHNSAMMTNTVAMSGADVCEHFAELRRSHGRPFLLLSDGKLMGDADLRHIQQGAAEFAIMIGQRKTQGKGFGTQFALMLHALAYSELALERIYVTIIPANIGSQRLFTKLGHELDNSAAARSYIDEEHDITMSMGRAEFVRRYAAALKEIRAQVLV